MLTKVLVAVGSNLPSRRGSSRETVLAAFEELNSQHIRVSAQSPLYSTPCMPEGAGPDYVNAAALLETERDAATVLSHLHDVEARFGRTRRDRWAARILDLDLLAWGDRIAPDHSTWLRWAELEPDQRGVVAPDQLILPHPRMQERAFVLVPLRDIAPDWRHPGLNRSVSELSAGLPAPELAAITRICDPESLAIRTCQD